LGFSQITIEVKFLLRFNNLAQREQMEDTYYASDDWRQGPREAMLALIENYTDIVLELDEITVQALRKKD
jgi:hypothetical protein